MTGRGGNTGDLKVVGSADCRYKGIDRGGMDTFFTKLVPFADCLEKKVSKLFRLACRYNIASVVAGGLSDYRVVKIAVVVSCCLDFALVLAEWG